MPTTLGSVVIACFGVSVFAQQGAAPKVDARQSDVYAIYSQMLTPLHTSHGADDNEIYLIGGITVPAYPAEPCVQVPSDRAERFAEVLADYRARKDIFATLKPAFQVAKPYRLLRTANIEEFEDLRTRLSEKVSDFIQLTDVYFDHGRTLALTALSTWCGGLCGHHQWRVFEKDAEGRWQERRWASCVTVADGGFRSRLFELSAPGVVAGSACRGCWVCAPQNGPVAVGLLRSAAARAAAPHHT